MRIWLYLYSLAYFLAHYPNIRHYDVSGLWPLSKQPYRFRHLLGQHDEDRALDTLLGTDKGIARLAEFIEVTDAFAKVPFV